jgi:hypothetical protein
MFRLLVWTSLVLLGELVSVTSRICYGFVLPARLSCVCPYGPKTFTFVSLHNIRADIWILWLPHTHTSPVCTARLLRLRPSTYTDPLFNYLFMKQ